MATDKITIADFMIWDMTCAAFENEKYKGLIGDVLKDTPLLKKHRDLGFKELKGHFEKSKKYPTGVLFENTYKIVYS